MLVEPEKITLPVVARSTRDYASSEAQFGPDLSGGGHATVS